MLVWTKSDVGSAVQCVNLVCESGHGILHFLKQGFNNQVSGNSAHADLHFRKCLRVKVYNQGLFIALNRKEDDLLYRLYKHWFHMNFDWAAKCMSKTRYI